MKTAREFWKELDWKEMEKGSLVGSGVCGTAGGVCVVDCMSAFSCAVLF